jgi:Carboxypeptidase regulatory-like domain
MSNVRRPNALFVFLGFALAAIIIAIALSADRAKQPATASLTKSTITWNTDEADLNGPDVAVLTAGDHSDYPFREITSAKTGSGGKKDGRPKSQNKRAEKEKEKAETSKAAAGSDADANEGEKEDNKDEVLTQQEMFWMDRLTYPTGRFDPKWVRRAAAQDRKTERAMPEGIDAKSVKQNFASMLNSSSFTSLGPSPENMTGCSGCYDYGKTQGRVNAIIVDPTTTTAGSIVAYIGTVGGGVWKTTTCCTSSTTWTLMTDDPLISTTAIDTLAIDPNNNNTIYAGTGDLNFGSFSMGSQGILKSTNGGANWTVLGASVFGAVYTEPTGNYPQYDSVGKVRVDPNDSNKIIAGTKKGLFLSYDGGTNWTGPCTTNTFNTQRQDTTGLELTNMGGGVTRILAAIGTRGFASNVQYDLGAQGANGLYKGTMPASGCPTDFSLITRNDNGFVFGTAVSGSPYATGDNMNAGSGVPYSSATVGNQLSRVDITVAPSNPNYIYVQVGSIAPNSSSGCGSNPGCQLGVWSSVDGGATWTFMTGSAGGSLRACGSTGTAGTTSGAAGSGDYNQNWYDQGMAVDPNNADRVFIDTFDTWVATRTGTNLYDLTCGYGGNSVANHVVHTDHHALAFLPGSSSTLLEGSDGGIFSTANADQAAEATLRPTWVNMDNGLNTVEFYSGDISANFATDSAPAIVGGAQDNGPSSASFAGTPTGPVSWQMGTGGDGFSGQIDPIGTGATQAVGTITVSGAGTVGQQFVIGTQTFTWAATRGAVGSGTVAIGTSANTAATNIRTAVNADIPTQVTAAGSNANVTITAVANGPSGNLIPFANINSTNTTFNGTGTLGGTTMGGLPGSFRFWEGNNSGGLSRCTRNCTSPGATWTSSRGSWTGDQQSFVLPINLFHGGIPGGDDCGSAGPTSGCGHLLAGTTRVWETISGAGATVPSASWYATTPSSCTGTNACLTKGTLGNRSYINQVKYSPKFQSVAIAGTNDGNVQIGFNLGTGVANAATWVDVTGGNAILPNRPVLGIALDPSVAAANVPVGYAAVGGFNANTLGTGILPATPGHVFQVTCTANCATFTWVDKTGNLPDIPADSVISNPNIPKQVFVGTDFGLYFTNDVTAATPVWTRFANGLPAVMIWDMQVDRGSTTLALFTRARGAFVWPLPLSPTSAAVSLGGRVTASDGRGIVNARVTISGGSLTQPVSTITGSFGYYQVDDLPAGGTYVVTVNSKRFTFSTPSQVVSLGDNRSDINFTADGTNSVGPIIWKVDNGVLPFSSTGRGGDLLLVPHRTRPAEGSVWFSSFRSEALEDDGNSVFE